MYHNYKEVKHNELKEQLRFDKSKQECYNIAQEVIMTTDIERKQNAEILTPLTLVNEMLSKIPEDAWTDLSRHLPRIFDPCVGKGAFVVVVYDLLWEKLEDLIPDEEKRKATILEDMIYFADINPFNIHVTKMILDPSNEYKLNSYCGNTLEMKFDFKFDIIVGNPPYNASGGTGTGNTIWQHFVKKYIRETKYLCFVHPPNWRKPCNKKSQLRGLFKLMTNIQMLYLSIHGINDGKKTFNAGTRYDWYVINCVKKYKDTVVDDEKRNEIAVDMSEFEWLPNYDIMAVKKLLAGSTDMRCQIIMNSSYHGTRPYVSNIENKMFKYKLVHSTPRSGIRWKYSNTNKKGHFGIPKVIFGEAGINDVVIDMKGDYGMTQGAMAIKTNSVKDSNNIKKALLSNEFQKILKCCIMGNFRIDSSIFTSLKKDFWKEFI